MERAANGVMHDEPISEPAAIVGAAGADGKPLITGAREQDCAIADAPHEHAAFGDAIDRHSQCEGRAFPIARFLHWEPRYGRSISWAPPHPNSTSVDPAQGHLRSR